MLPSCEHWMMPLQLWKMEVMGWTSPTSDVSWTVIWMVRDRESPISDQWCEQASVQYTQDSLALVVSWDAMWTCSVILSWQDFQHLSLLHSEISVGDPDTQKHKCCNLGTGKKSQEGGWQLQEATAVSWELSKSITLTSCYRDFPQSHIWGIK